MSVGKRSFRHLKRTEREVIQRMLKANKSKKDIADVLGISLRTVYYEIKRGTYEHLNSDLSKTKVYSAELAQNKYDSNIKSKGRKPKLLCDNNLQRYISTMITDLQYSPYAILEIIKTNNMTFSVSVSSVNTIYSGIQKGYIPNVSMETLPMRGKQRKGRKKNRVIVRRTAAQKRNIADRPAYITNRETFGHWEMDCVCGQRGNRKTALVLTERKTRIEIIEVLKEHSGQEVVKALNRLEKRLGTDFYKIFKTITCDNGTEFSYVNKMEKALYRVGKRTEIYFCNPYSPHERGSNENCNLLIRRHLPKGSNFDKRLNRNIAKDIQFWINSYPRMILDGKNAIECCNKELEELGCRYRL